MELISYIYNRNQWDLDPDLAPVLSHTWPNYINIEAELRAFGDLAGGQNYLLANLVTKPLLVKEDENGNPIDRVQLTPEHAKLLKAMVQFNRLPFDEAKWIHYFTLGYLMANPGLFGSLVVTNQTALIIQKYAPELLNWLNPLFTGDAWGAIWMTESQGGSDLSIAETKAVIKDREWRLSGKKTFAINAGLADIALVTAYPENAEPSARGLGLFLVPRINENQQLNFRVQRLLCQTGGCIIPVGEVVLDNSLAYMVGGSSFGIYYALESLTLSRLASTAMLAGIARKAYLESLFWVKNRLLRKSPLVEKPLIQETLTDMAVRNAGAVALTFYAISVFDRSWREEPPYSAAFHYARLLSYLAKGRTAEHAVHITKMGMDIFGGRGFMENYSMIHLHQNALVTSAWGGTENIDALEMLKVLQKEDIEELFLVDAVSSLEQYASPSAKLAREKILHTLDRLKKLPESDAEWFSKSALRVLADGVQVGLLYKLAENAGGRYAKLANIYAEHFLRREPYPNWILNDKQIWDIPEIGLADNEKG